MIARRAVLGKRDNSSVGFIIITHLSIYVIDPLFLHKLIEFETSTSQLIAKFWHTGQSHTDPDYVNDDTIWSSDESVNPGLYDSFKARDISMAYFTVSTVVNKLDQN